MTGDTDLSRMLATLTVSQRPGAFTMITLAPDVAVAADLTLGAAGVEAVIAEAEGITIVATVEEAEARGWPVGFVGAWLTLDVHSALEAVGLTAAVATALAVEGIPANMLAGFYHDHLLVPPSDAARAIEVLENLAP